MTYRLEAVDHVQLVMPAGPDAEARAIAFYSGLLGLTQVPKPPPLDARGGCWFGNGSVTLHLGVEEPFSPAKKAHPGLAVSGLDELVATLESAGHAMRRVEDVPGMPQAFVFDPFGNRIELVPVTPSDHP